MYLAIYQYILQLKGENKKYQENRSKFKKNVGIVSFYSEKPSFFNSFFFVFVPPGLEKPPNVPSDLITL